MSLHPWARGLFILLLYPLLYPSLAQALLPPSVIVNGSNTWTAGDNPGADVTVTGSGTTLTLGAGSYHFNSLTVQNSATVVASSSVTVTIDSNMNIDALSSFNADGMGYPGASGPGNGANTTSSGPGGGAYGGPGGRGKPANFGSSVFYGSITQPTDLGSGGGNLTASGLAGGAGGGAIKLVVTGTLTVDGNLSASGATGTTNTFASAGGGSGGSIWLQVGTLAGAGYIFAKGGDSPTVSGSWGGGGGGGRIALYYTTNSFAGSLYVDGGNGFNSGSAGTIAGPYAADKLVFQFRPSSSGQVGKNLTAQPVVVPVSSTHNNWVDVNYTGNVTLTAYSDSTCTTPLLGATVPGSPVAISNGAAVFTGVQINRRTFSGLVYLKATSGSLTSACSLSVNMTGSTSPIFFKGY
ncbi:MAG: hypothetical protein ACJ763_11605 [Bdellovibrionia bacterium]